MSDATQPDAGGAERGQADLAERARQRMAQRRARGARSLAAFGQVAPDPLGAAMQRVVHEGDGPTVHTIGYEKRTNGELAELLSRAGVKVLVDVRADPMSRRAEFRPGPLDLLCQGAGLRYEPMPELGAPEHQRDALKETGDLPGYLRKFRRHARAKLVAPLDKLAELARREPVALMCYERLPEQCHRSVLADLLAQRHGVRVVAIV